jgi:hypothetical protein
MNKLQKIKEETLEILDDNYMGLRPTSNTNKSRYAVLELIDKAYEAGKKEIIDIVKQEKDTLANNNLKK